MGLQRPEHAGVVGDAHGAQLRQSQPAQVVDVQRGALGVLAAGLRGEQAEMPELGRQPLAEAVARADRQQRVGPVVLERADDANLVRRQLAQHREERGVDTGGRFAVHRRGEQVEVTLAQRRPVTDAARQRLRRERQRRARAGGRSGSRSSARRDRAACPGPASRSRATGAAARPPSSPSRSGPRPGRRCRRAHAAARGHGWRAWRFGRLHVLCRRSSATGYPILIRTLKGFSSAPRN